VRVHADADAASRAAADAFAAAAREAIVARGRFVAVLAGGTAPLRTYALLAEEPRRSAIDWARVHLFWGDERCVPPGHPRSNFGAAWRHLSRLPIPPANVHRMRGELSAVVAAAAYEREIAEVMGPGAPRWDLLHLGIGPDGHTASLFPFAPVLLHLAANVTTALKLPEGEWRVTLTVPALNSARRVDFLAFGADKARTLRSVLRAARDPLRLPAELVAPGDGTVVWHLDRPAASLLDGG
jgi:6-phosphogluconolactonase